MPCDQRVACPCDELPLSNFSSEDPDRLIYLGRHFGFSPPPRIIDQPTTNQGCTTFSNSLIDQADSDWCALFTLSACEVNANLTSPCWLCRGPATPLPSGGIWNGPNWGYNVVTPSGEPPDPCCNPSLPEDCCCQTEPQDPNLPPTPPTPPRDDGGGDGGGPPPPGGPPIPFTNDEQTCTVECEDGKQYTATIKAGSFSALSKAQANAMAKSAACEKAKGQKICTDPGFGGGDDCKVFCKGIDGSLQIDAVSKDGLDLTFSVQSGALPQGMTMDSSGNITGTPTTVGETNVTILIADSAGNTTTKALCIKIMDITTETLGDAAICSAYSAKIDAAGGFGTYTFTIAFGSLPDGLTMDSSGNITGSPIVPGTFGFTVAATDTHGNSCSKDLEITVTGISSDEVTVYCPTDTSKSYTLTAGAVTPCGPYAGYTQAELNSQASIDAFNALQSQCPCAMTLVAALTRDAFDLTPNACVVTFYILAVLQPGSVPASYGLGPNGPGNINLYDAINTLQGNPVWNPGYRCGPPPPGNWQKPLDGAYDFYADAGHTKFCFSIIILTPCP